MANEPENNEDVEPVVGNDHLPRHLKSSDEEDLAFGELPAPEESHDVDLQDNFVENKEPAELMFCVILASIYAGLARYCWTPLEQSGMWNIFINIEGFFITIALLALLLGLRPYLSPSSLQISKHGLKYRGPYWPQRKTVNWSQVVHMYVSPELILIIYKLPHKQKEVPAGSGARKHERLRPLLVHSVYLADRDKVADSILKYSPIEPTLVANPGIVTRTVQIVLFLMVVLWIVNILKG